MIGEGERGVSVTGEERGGVEGGGGGGEEDALYGR